MPEAPLEIKILFPSQAACDACLAGADITDNFRLELGDGVVLDGEPPIPASGLSVTEILVQAVITVATGVSVKVISDRLIALLSRSEAQPKISIGGLVVTSASPTEIEIVVSSALQRIGNGNR